MGALYVVATPIGNLDDMTPRAVETLRTVSLIAAEDTRHTAGLLHRFDIGTPTISYHQHNERHRADRILSALNDGDVALVTDAGTPAISDPGLVVVRAAREAGHPVIPIPGASSVIASVSVSGLVDGPYLFLGFLPRGGEARRGAIGRAVASQVPVVVFESPRRLVETLRDLEVYFGDVEAVVARELTKVHEDVRGGPLLCLARQYDQEQVRGEVCIVIEAASRNRDQETDDATELGRRLLADGLKPSKAARELAHIASISGTEAYDIIRKLQEA